MKLLFEKISKLNNSTLLVIVLSLTLILVASRGFYIYHSDYKIISPDEINYFNLTRFFRGELSFSNCSEPFTYRPITPLLASILPFNPYLSIAIIQTIACLLNVVISYYILTHLNKDRIVKFYSLLAVFFTFPVFYYTATARVDSLGITFISLMTLCIIRNKSILFFFLFPLALLTKETCVIIIVFFFFYKFSFNDILNQNNRKVFFQSILLLLLFFGTQIIVRYYMSNSKVVVWHSSLEALYFNLSRIRSFTSQILSSLTFLPIIYLLFKYKIKLNFKDNKIILSSVMSFIFGIATYLYAFLSAYPDGRFVWIAFPFIMILISNILESYWATK